MDPRASSSSGEAGPSQAGLGKHKCSLSNMNPGSRALQGKKACKAFTKQPKKPKKPSDWHMRKGEVPKEAEKTKAAPELHLCVLWGLPHQTTVPPKVTEDDKVPFTRRFTSEAQLQNSVTASLDDNSASIQGTQMKVHELRLSWDYCQQYQVHSRIPSVAHVQVGGMPWASTVGT